MIQGRRARQRARLDALCLHEIFSHTSLVKGSRRSRRWYAVAVAVVAATTGRQGSIGISVVVIVQ